MTEAYPLQWPASWPRNQKPQRGAFMTSLAGATKGLVYELEKLGAKNIVINSNMMIRSDGLPYARQSKLDDTGVAVYFTLNDEQRCIPCDKWIHVEDNVQAIRKTVEALRGLDRWGAKAIVDAAFSGFKMLPESSEPTAEAWYDILGVDPFAEKWEIREAYKKLIKKHHPDVGGLPPEFERIHQAYQKGMKS